MARLGDICDVRDGTHDSPPYVNKGYPLVTSKNIVDGNLDLSVINHITLEDYNKINERSKVDSGDIIMPMIGTIGNPYLVGEFTEFAIKNVALIKFNNEQINNKYIYYFLNSNKFKKYIAETNRGGTQKFLSLKDIRNMEVNIASLDKQLEIVEILDKISGLIYDRKQQVLKLDEFVKSRFIELFGAFPKQRLGDYCSTHARIGWQKLTRAEFLETGDYYLVTGWDFDVKNRVVDFSKCYYVSKERYEQDKKLMLKVGDVLLTKDGTLGKVAIINEMDKPATLNGHIFVIRPLDERLLPHFLVGCFASDDFKYQMEQNKTGSTIVGVTQKALLEFQIPIAPIDLQVEFKRFMQQTDKSKLAVQQSLEKLETLKKSLMQQYFG